MLYNVISFCLVPATELSDLHNVSFYERVWFPFVQEVKGMCSCACATGDFPLVTKTNITPEDTHVPARGMQSVNTLIKHKSKQHSEKTRAHTHKVSLTLILGYMFFHTNSKTRRQVSD